MANLSYKVDLSHHATISIRGEIVAGDAERFAEDVRRTHLDPELPSITAALDSPGGDYLEGLALGNTFRRLGYGTRVDSGAECYSAVAFAFLGGAYLGAVGGWGPDRTVEVGAKIGFHSFYSSATELVGIGKGIEHGKRLTMILADYATALRIDMNFTIESLEHGPHELLLLQTVQHFRDLKAKIFGLTPATELTAERAIIAANYATNWKRPVSLQPHNREAMAVVQQLTASEYHRNILGHLIAPEYCCGPMTKLIRATIQADRSAQIDELFDDAKRLNAVPSTWAVEASTIFHVRGFEYGALFYVTDCYVIESNVGSANLALSVVKVHFQNHLETVSYSPAGDILYEVHLPNTVLWPPTPGLV